MIILAILYAIVSVIHGLAATMAYADEGEDWKITAIAAGTGILLAVAAAMFFTLYRFEPYV